jgi:hypothetical protein
MSVGLIAASLTVALAIIQLRVMSQPMFDPPTYLPVAYALEVVGGVGAVLGLVVMYRIAWPPEGRRR